MVIYHCVFIHRGDLGFLSTRFFASAFLCQEDKGQERSARVCAGGGEERLLPLTPVADSPLPVASVRMKLEADQLAQPWWELCQGCIRKEEEVLMHITPPSAAEPRNQISAMTLVSTGIRQGILSCAVLGCYEWTFMLEPCSLEAREGLRYLQVNLSGRLHVSHAPALPGPQPCLVCSSLPKGWGPFGVDGSSFVGPHPRWVDTWYLSAGRCEVKDIHPQNSPRVLCLQQCSHQPDVPVRYC